MANTDRNRFLSAVVRGVPVALLAALVSLPAAALTIETGSGATSSTAQSSGSGVALQKAARAELKMQKRAEKKARKACKKAMKRAKKRGETYSCGASGSGAEPEAAGGVESGVESIVAEEPASDSANDASRDGKPANPAQGGASGSQGNPGSSGPPGNPGRGNSGNPDGEIDEGSTDGVIRNALVGPDSIPSGLTPESILDVAENNEGGGDEIPPSTAPAEQVPEPGSLALLGLGLMGLAIGQRPRVATRR